LSRKLADRCSALFASAGNCRFLVILLQAQGSKAKVVALAKAGVDTTNAIKQAHEFGLIAGGQTVLPMLAFITDVKALGLDNAAGLRFTDGFYWDRTTTPEHGAAIHVAQ